MADFGGCGGVAGGRPRDETDLFECAVERALGEKLRAEHESGEDEHKGHFKASCTGARLWGGLANMGWVHENGDTASYSFRAAGDLIAAVVGAGDYIRWYCSSDYAVLYPDIVEAMAKEGWHPDPEDARAAGYEPPWTAPVSGKEKN